MAKSSKEVLISEVRKTALDVFEAANKDDEIPHTHFLTD
jgi:hypothetical protein